MALPNPIPDNPLKWTGWKDYNSPNPYERLCLSYSANATAEMIEEHCRQLLVWWQKKLPLKNQPSNPMAQLLRQGLDEAPHFLAEARTILLDPEQRKVIDSKLNAEVVEKALDDFKKLLGFALADKRLTKDSEGKLYAAAERLGLSQSDVDPVIAAEMEAIGAVRVVDEPPPAPAPASAAPVNGGAHAPATPGNPFDEFRRLLKMSRLCLEGEEMSDDQRDAMCNLGESLGLTGGQAEDLIDEYLEEMASMPVAPPTKAAATPNRPPPKPVTPAPAAKAASVATAPAKPAAPAAPAQAAPPKKDPALEVNLSPAARAMERQKYPNFTNKVGVELLLVPSGRFTMGSTAPTAQLNENPLTVVTLSRYYLSRFPITNIQYEAFDPSHKAKRPPWADDNHPVVYVTWNDADNFCKWLTRREGKIYRLPTEAEWEYAARGEDDRAFPWGEWNPSVRLANFADASTTFPWRDPTMNDGFAESSPVGSYPRGASPFGIEDMAGNVFEWSLDWYEPYKGKELVNPRPGQSGRHRVCRGGSWKSRLSSLRTTARAFNEPAYFSNDFGFRIVCECM